MLNREKLQILKIMIIIIKKKIKNVVFFKREKVNLIIYYDYCKFLFK